MKLSSSLLWGALATGMLVLVFFAEDALQVRRVAAHRVERRLTGLHELAVRYKDSSNVSSQYVDDGIPLFSLFNTHAEQAGLKSHVEQLQPRPSPDGKQPERLEARLNNVYQESAMRLLASLEQIPGIRMESLALTRTGEGLLNVNMVVARHPAPRS